jgi:acetyl-CoA synthetase
VVRLGIASEAELRAAYAELMRNAQKAAAPGEINGVLVQPMVAGGVELVVGAKLDASFGPLVLVGLGGVFTEVLKDTVTELAPVGTRRARRMLERLGAQPLLDGFRGAPPVDRDQVAEVIVRVSELISDLGDSISEVDVNPLICAGSRVVAVDALLVRKP